MGHIPSLILYTRVEILRRRKRISVSKWGILCIQGPALEGDSPSNYTHQLATKIFFQMWHKFFHFLHAHLSNSFVFWNTAGWGQCFLFIFWWLYPLKVRNNACVVLAFGALPEDGNSATYCPPQELRGSDQAFCSGSFHWKSTSPSSTKLSLQAGREVSLPASCPCRPFDFTVFVSVILGAYCECFCLWKIRKSDSNKRHAKCSLPQQCPLPHPLLFCLKWDSASDSVSKENALSPTVSFLQQSAESSWFVPWYFGLLQDNNRIISWGTSQPLLSGCRWQHNKPRNLSIIPFNGCCLSPLAWWAISRNCDSECVFYLWFSTSVSALTAHVVSSYQSSP